MEKQKAVIITTEGKKSVVEFDFGNSYQLLSDAVGGMIECVGLEGVDLWCNENGIAEGLSLNMIASAIYSDDFKHFPLCWCSFKIKCYSRCSKN